MGPGSSLSTMAGNPLSRGNEVARQENNGFGPLFKPRGKAARNTSYAVVFVAICVTLSWIMVKGKEKEKEKEATIHFLLFTTALFTFNSVLGELLRRLILMLEEFRHKDTRYQGKWKRVFEATFPLDHFKRSLLAAILSAIILWYEHHRVFSRQNIVLLSLNCLVIPQVLSVVGLRQLSPVEIADLNEKGNKNVADGLAWSYYFGYLKLMLPKLKEQIDKSEQLADKIQKKKVFILLPKTCVIHGDIGEADPRVKWVDHLPELAKSVGGIKDRVYKHGVYKIENKYPDGTEEEYHFILEYATSLKTLQDMSQQRDALFDREERDYQVVLFIQKLTEILNNSPECRGTYELVPISGDGGNEISEALMRMLNDANVEVHNPEANGVHRPAQ